MNVVVLLSAGRHPVSGKPVLPKVEAQAIRLAAGLGEASGLHAGQDAFPAEVALGHGLARAEHIRRPAGSDPVDALATRLTALAPDVVLAGRRGQGGDETGLVPYAVAARLDAAIVADVIAVRPAGDGLLTVDQALAKGALRRLTVRTPVVLTVHPSAPAPWPFAFGRARRRRVEPVDAACAGPAEMGRVFEERPYRKRPRIIRLAPGGGSASDRLKAITGETSSGGADVLVDPAPDAAAREILAYLRRVGVLAPAGEAGRETDGQTSDPAGRDI